MTSVLLFTILIMLACNTELVSSSKKLNPKGKNVCKYHQSVIAYYTRQTQVNTLESYSTCCSKFLICWKKCKRSRVKTKTITMTISKLRRQEVLHCCEGYAVDSSRTGCSKPICNPPCENGGKCIEPGMCKCAFGFEGRLCQNDINECTSTGVHECSQRCINIPGSYLCACNRGYVPGDANSRTCKDINECKQTGNSGNRVGPCRCIGGKCGNKCQNTIGGYRCMCGKGYKLTLWNSCVDRNECIETPDVCPDKCINTLGSYKCECWEGFRWNKINKKCEEIDECSIGNGGCEQMCHNVYGGHVCSCKSGFYLADNRFSCIDINECQWTTKCDKRRSECINVPGSYYCKCKIGFKFIEPYGICLDRDECLEKTALCSQKCFNTFGSYRCGCNEGYALDSDLRTCRDIDECSQKRCHHICVNTPGSYKCFCNQGYEFDIDDRMCIPKFCEQVQAPFFGRMKCDGYTVGKRCRFSCNKGYHLDRDIERECLPHGKWSNLPPKCIPNSCKQPRPPLNGKLLLPCEVSYGSTCPVSCLDGYVLRGPDLIKCELSRGAMNWNVYGARCEEILVCKPNPCQHGGVCSIINPTTYRCNCSATGHEGHNCEIGFITTEKMPKMKKDETVIMKFRAKPVERVELRIYPEDKTVKISKEVVWMTNSQQASQIKVTGTKVGMKLLSYELTSEELYAAPKPSLLLVYDPATVGRFRGESLATFGSDCFSMALTLKGNTCSVMTITSTAPWFKRSSSLPGTNGVAFIGTAGEKFPLLLPGVDQRDIFRESELAYKSIAKPPGCRKSLLREEQFQYIGKQDLFSRDFVTVFNKFLPPWFQFELRRTMKYFSEDMIRSLLMTGNQLKRKKFCSTMAVDDSSIFVVHLIHEHLVLKVGEEELVIDTNKAFCLAFDLCKKEAHFQFPDQYGADVLNLLPFKELLSFKWKVKLRSLGFAETSISDSRKCLKNGSGKKMMLFGGSRVTYSNEYGINSYVTGIMAAGFKITDSKTVIDSARLCVDGESLVESPSWTSSSLQGNPYALIEEEDSTDVIKLTMSSLNPQKSIFSLEQQGGAVFKIKSGLRPLIKQSSRDIRFDVGYKVSEKASELTTDNNFDKYTYIETISYSLGDINMELELMYPPAHLASGVKNVRVELKTWLDLLNNDIEKMLMDIDNTKMMNEKVRVHFKKGKLVTKSISNLMNTAKASIESGVVKRIANSLEQIKSQLTNMGKSLKSVVKIMQFDSVSAHFNGSMCLFQPCIEAVSVKLHPQSIENPWDGFCYDASKTSFQMWDTKATVLARQDLGKFFTFAPGDKFHVCYSVFGINKGEFEGRFNLFGGNSKLTFKYGAKKITVPTFVANVAGKYKFKVNGTVETVLDRWDMMSVTAYGTAGAGSKIIIELQRNMDMIVSHSYHSLKKREQNSRARLQDLFHRNGSIRGKMNHFQQKLKETKDLYNRARKVFLRRERKYKKLREFFASNRNAYLDMRRRLDALCSVSSCSLQCHKINNCTVCQREITIPKTVPKCRRITKKTEYAYKDHVDTMCSHVVEDRRLKYTGNCKRPLLEKHRAKQIVDRLKHKQENKLPFTLEDAWDLELIDEKEGKKLEKAVRQQMFFRALPGKLKSASLEDEDFEQIEKYTNRTFAQKIRADQKQIKLKLLWDELSWKIKSGGRLNDADIERIRKLDEKFAAKLKINMDINEKLQSGKQPSKDELKRLEKLDPSSYEAFIKKRRSSETRRNMVSKIAEKLRNGTFTGEDLKELSKVSPEIAKKIESSLKEQLNQKLNEMKTKLGNVSSAISTGDGSDRLRKLNNKLDSMTKTLKPLDKNQLKNLQDRIKHSVAAKGSVFDKMLGRFDLALELYGVTRKSSEFLRSLKAFFAALGNFDLSKMFLQTENMIVKYLKHLQGWFQTLVSLLEKLCSRCGKSCDEGGIIRKTMNEVRLSIESFKTKVCSNNKLVDTRQFCLSLNGMLSFVQRYDITHSRSCGEIKDKFLPLIQKTVNKIKDLGRADFVVFDKLWKTSDSTLSIKRAYNSAVVRFKEALSSSSVKVNFPAPDFKVITNEVGKIIRPGLYSTKDIQYFIARQAVSAFNDALKLLPIDTKQMNSKSISIQSDSRRSLLTQVRALLDSLTESLLNLCSRAADRSEISAATNRRVKRILDVGKSLFGKMLKVSDILSLFRGAQNVAATLDHALKMADAVKGIGSKCSNTTDQPFAELEAFLLEVKDFGAKSVQQLSGEVDSKLKEIGAGIKAPIGKLVNLVEQIAEGFPTFDVPVILSMGYKESKLLLEAFKKYLGMIGDVFNKLIEVVRKCRNCKLEEVFGGYNLRSIAVKLDKKLGPIVSKLDKFISDVNFAPQGTPLLLSSLEQIRTDLQSIYKSEAVYSEKTFSDIVQGVKYTSDAVDLIDKGLVDFQIRFVGGKKSEIRTFVTEVTNLKSHMKELYLKTKATRMEKTISRMKKALSNIPVLTAGKGKLEKGTVDQLLDSLNDIGDIVKSVTMDIVHIYRSPVSGYVENTWLPKVAKSLSRIENVKVKLITETERLLVKFGIVRNDSVSRQNMSNMRERKYSKMYKKLRNAHKNSKIAKALRIAQKSEKDDSMLKQFTSYWRGVYRKVVGKIDSVKSRLLNLRKSFQKYLDLYKDIKTTVEQIKKGPMSDIGMVKDSLEDLTSSFKDYNFKKLLLSNPGIFKEKVKELRALFQLTGSAVERVDDLIKNCSSCSADKILGYGYIKSLANTVDKSLYTYLEFLEGLGDKVTEGVVEIQSMKNAVIELRQRYDKIGRGKVKASEILAEFGETLTDSAKGVKKIEGSVERFAEILVGNDIDMQLLGNSIRTVSKQLGAVVNQSAEVAANVEGAYRDVKRVEKIVNELLDGKGRLGKGPIEARIAVAKEAFSTIKMAVNALPRVVNASKKALTSAGIDGDWINEFQSSLMAGISAVEKMRLKTDKLLNTAGIIVQGKENVTKGLGFVKERLKELRDAPWDKKIRGVRSFSKALDALMGSSLEAVISGSNAFGLELSKEGLTDSIQTSIGKKRLERLNAMTAKISNVVGKLQRDSLPEIGKITDAVENYVTGLKDFDIKKALLSDPSVLKEKIGEFQELAHRGGDILLGMANITGFCDSCSFEGVLGNRFAKRISKDIAETFDKLYDGVLDISSRVKKGRDGVQRFVDTAKDISNQFNSVLNRGKVSSDTFISAASALKKSAMSLQSLKGASKEIFEALFDDQDDVSKLLGGFNSVVDAVSDKLANGSELSEKVEKAYTTIQDVNGIFDKISSGAKDIGRSPLEVKTELARKMVSDVKDILKAVPSFLQQSSNLSDFLRVNSSWLDSLSGAVVKFNGKASSIFAKTDSLLKSAGLIAKDITDIGNTSNEIFKDIEGMRKLPVKEKFKAFRGIVEKVDKVLDTGVEAAVKIESTTKELTGTELNISEGIGKFGDSISGFMQNISKGVKFTEGLYDDITKTVDQIKLGPVAKVGALTDSIEDFVGSLGKYDLAEVLVQAPKFAKGKIGELKAIIKDSGKMLGNVNSLVNKYCPGCKIDEIFGNEFTKKVGSAVRTGFDRITGNVTKFLDKVAEGGENVFAISNYIKGIDAQLKSLDGVKFNSEGLKEISNFLGTASGLVGSIGDKSTQLAGVLFEKNKALNKLTGKFEGLANFVGGFINSTGKVVSGMRKAADRVEKIRDLYEEVKSGFKGASKGPLESRIKAVESVADGLAELTSGIPDLVETLDPDNKFATFVRGFGSKVTEIANGISDVVRKTGDVVGDVRQTVKAVDNIGRISNKIGDSFTKLLNSPFSGKISAVKNIVSQVKSLTNEVNSATGTMSNAVNKLTGKSILNSPIFGKTTEKVLNDISGAVNLVADRYEKFQSLTKTVDRAFKSISSNPVDFALNDLPKLVTQTEGLVSTLISDTKGIAAKLGLELESLSLNPELVSASKEFFAFAKSTLGTIQSGKELFGNFKDLFTSKDFESGMKNFQSVINNGNKFLENIDSLGQQLFKEKWSGIKGDFQKTLNKIGDSVGLNLEKTGEIFGKISGSIGDFLSIASDVKNLLNMKELNFNTALAGAKSVINIGKSFVNVLNRFGANIQTKVFQSLSNALSTVTFVFNIAKGIFDFIKWINDVCDITFATKVNKKEFRYKCLKGKISTMLINIPEIECEYKAINVTRGYGNANLCCSGKRCLYVQNQNCLRNNTICVEKQKEFLNSTSWKNRDLRLAKAYLEFEKAMLSMEVAQNDMRAAEILYQRQSLAYNLSLTEYTLNDLRTKETRRYLESISQNVRKIRRVKNHGSNTTKIHFLKAEFNTVFYSANIDRIPLKIILRDEKGSHKIARIMVDFARDQQSLKQATDYLLRTMTDYKFTRKRRDVGKIDEPVEPKNVHACTEVTNGLSLLSEAVRTVRKSVSELPKNQDGYLVRKTASIKMSRNAFYATRQLLQEARQLNLVGHSTLKSVIDNWNNNIQQWIRETYKQDCFDLKDCLDILVDAIGRLMDSASSRSLRLMANLKHVASKLITFATLRSRNSSVIASLNEIANSLDSVHQSAIFCVKFPTFEQQQPSSLTTYLGEELTISCKVDIKDGVRYVWYLNKTVLPAYNGEVLRISNVTSAYEGSYHCKVYTELGTVKRNPIYVSVAKRIKFLENLHSVSIPNTNPHEVHLICNTTAGDDARFTWWFQSLSGRVRKLRSSSAMLNVGIARARKNGMFWCEVSNGHMKLRSKKAVVSLVQSKMRTHAVKVEMQYVLTGKNCRPSAAKELLEDAVRESIFKGKDVGGYRTRVILENMRKQVGRFSMMLLFQPQGFHHLSDLNLTASDAQMQYSVRKIASSFIEDREAVRVNVSDFILTILKSNAIMEFDPAGWQCPSGMGLTTGRLRCETCLPGYFESGLSSCIKCPLGTYQPRFGALSCVPCGNGYMTPFAGSIDHTSCLSSEFKCFDRINLMVAFDTMAAQSMSYMTSFIRDLLQHFSLEYTKLSVVSFGNVVRLLDADAFQTDETLKNIKFGTEERRTDLLLDMATGFFGEDYPGYRNSLLIVSHGPTTQNTDSMEGKVTRLKELGTDIFYMNVGPAKARKEEAMLVSSSPKEIHVFSSGNGGELMRSSIFVANAICNNDNAETLSSAS